MNTEDRQRLAQAEAEAQHICEPYFRALAFIRIHCRLQSTADAPSTTSALRQARDILQTDDSSRHLPLFQLVAPQLIEVGDFEFIEQRCAAPRSPVDQFHRWMEFATHLAEASHLERSQAAMHEASEAILSSTDTAYLPRELEVILGSSAPWVPLAQAGRATEALALFDEIQKRVPKSKASHFIRPQILFHSGERLQSLEACRNGITLFLADPTGSIGQLVAFMVHAFGKEEVTELLSPHLKTWSNAPIKSPEDYMALAGIFHACVPFDFYEVVEDALVSMQSGDYRDGFICVFLPALIENGLAEKAEQWLGAVERPSSSIAVLLALANIYHPAENDRAEQLVQEAFALTDEALQDSFFHETVFSAFARLSFDSPQRQAMLAQLVSEESDDSVRSRALEEACRVHNRPVVEFLLPHVRTTTERIGAAGLALHNGDPAWAEEILNALPEPAKMTKFDRLHWYSVWAALAEQRGLKTEPSDVQALLDTAPHPTARVFNIIGHLCGGGPNPHLQDRGASRV